MIRLSNRCGVLFLVLVSLVASGCDEKLSDIAGPTPALEPTLSSIQRDIFNAADGTGRLACTQCHTVAARNFVGGLALTEGASFGDLVGQPSRNKPGAIRVVPGDPDNSYLIHKLEGSASISGARMPRNAGPFLTAGQISIIRRWIQLGAKND